MIFVLQRIEDFYDAVPRSGARVEQHGRLRLFVRDGVGWPFYARPTGEPITAADVLTMRERQREIGVPQAFEWIDDLAPTMAAAAREAGLVVHLCPLLVLDTERAFSQSIGAELQVLTGDEPAAELALVEAVATVGFGACIGTDVGPAGEAARDAAAAGVAADRVEQLRAGLLDGTAGRVAAHRDNGPLACGGYQQALGVAEIVGVATLPAARRRGLGGAVAARLASLARDRGNDTVFLSAHDDDVARVYERIGFRRVATAGLAEPPA